MLQGVLKMFFSENNKIISSDLRYNKLTDTYYQGKVLPDEKLSNDYKIISCCVINDDEIKKNDQCFDIENKKIIKFSGNEKLENLKKVIVLPHQVSSYLYSDIFFRRIKDNELVEVEVYPDLKLKLRRDGTVAIVKVK